MSAGQLVLTRQRCVCGAWLGRELRYAFGKCWVFDSASGSVEYKQGIALFGVSW